MESIRKQNQFKICSSFIQIMFILVFILLIILTNALQERNYTATTSKLLLMENSNKTNKLPSIASYQFGSSQNITILHEVRKNVNKESSVVLKTHEVLPLKPIKTIDYNTFENNKPQQYNRSVDLKELHPVTFDFNLGDLEDLEHETTKKEDLSNEDRRLLRDENNDGLTYTHHTYLGTDIDKILHNTTPTPIKSTLVNMPTKLIDITKSKIKPTTTSGTYVQKIFKIKQTKKEQLKNNERQSKKVGNNLNSINRHISSNVTKNLSEIAGNHHEEMNNFQILINLYDHFYWQPSKIRAKVRTGCALEMQAYLTALHANYDWAQQAYDVSGRYRGQMLFGNDKWLGQFRFCSELNSKSFSDERKHFEFEFFIAEVKIKVLLPEKLQSVLSVGECLPKSCSTQDVQAILTLDPHADLLTSLDISNTTNFTQIMSTSLQILRVRTVPGVYNIWHELKLQLFSSFFLTLIFLVVFASYYQFKLDESQKEIEPISAICTRIETGSLNLNPESESYYAKPLELFQMRNLKDIRIPNDSNIEIDVNGNKDQSCITANPTNIGLPIDTEIEKSDTTEYNIETNRCTDVTATDVRQKQLNLHERILLCFAFQTNAKALLSINKINKSNTSCLHGLRVLSLLWTIMVHTYLQMFAIGENKYQRKIVERSVVYQIVGNATFSVDTFFFISGLLVTLLYFKQKSKISVDTKSFIQRSCFDVLKMFVYRYARLTPTYLFVVFFNDFVVRQGLESSVFQPAKIEYNTCRQFWWRNILYINNFYPMQEICMIWSWYMANDMQFFVMAAILLTFSKRYFKLVVFILITFLLSSWCIAGLISLQHKYTHKVSLPFESFDYLYDKPWQRVGAYITGMFIGYVLHKVKTPPKVSLRINAFLWIVSIGLMLTIVFGVWNGELSLLSTAFYVGVGHTVFAFGLVWIVLSCCWGLAPTINNMLSYRIFWPLSRLTYCAYLVHPIIMFILSADMSGTVHLTNTLILTMFLGNAVISFFMAFIVSSILEAPVIRLLKICYKK